MAEAQKPLELILARNLLSSISTPAFLVDAEGTLVFFNKAVGALVGRRFEETGALGRGTGASVRSVRRRGPADSLGPVAVTLALQHGRSMHSRLHIQGGNGDLREMEVSALPIVGTGGFRGAIAIFWPVVAEEGAAA
jgi:PAS domain-containing protein